MTDSHYCFSLHPPSMVSVLMSDSAGDGICDDHSFIHHFPLDVKYRGLTPDLYKITLNAF